MNIEIILDKFKSLAEEWENFECGGNQETDEWCSATEDAIWGCAEKLSDLISEIEEEEI
jgi:hypothetical protein